MKALCFLALVGVVFVSHSVADDKTFDCKMRKLALEFAHKLQPQRTAAQFQQLADALNGAPEAHGLCNVSIDTIRGQVEGNSRFPSIEIRSAASSTVYVDATKGSDSGKTAIQYSSSTAGSAEHAWSIIILMFQISNPETYLLYEKRCRSNGQMLKTHRLLCTTLSDAP